MMDAEATQKAKEIFASFDKDADGVLNRVCTMPSSIFSSGSCADRAYFLCALTDSTIECLSILLQAHALHNQLTACSRRVQVLGLCVHTLYQLDLALTQRCLPPLSRKTCIPAACRISRHLTCQVYV